MPVDKGVVGTGLCPLSHNQVNFFSESENFVGNHSGKNI
jgi:hypothetical protein